MSMDPTGLQGEIFHLPGVSMEALARQITAILAKTSPVPNSTAARAVLCAAHSSLHPLKCQEGGPERL